MKRFSIKPQAINKLLYYLINQTIIVTSLYQLIN